MKLCCQINGKYKCKVCAQMFCSDDVYATDGLLRWVVDPFCHPCFLEKRATKMAEPREGITFKELFLKVRELIPSGYISIAVSLNDHRPEGFNFEYEWTIYHEKFGHCAGKTPEEALKLLRIKMELDPPDQTLTSAESINI